MGQRTETSNERKLNFFKRIFRNELDILIFFVISKCNSKCIGCFNWNGLNQPDDLTLDEIKKISKNMPKFSHILFSGGEPTLREELSEICEIFHRNNGIRSVSIPCNGIMPHKIEERIKQVMDRNPKISVGVHFSLDGIGDTHDRLRGVTGNFKKLEESVIRLNKIKDKYPQLDINVNSVISSENYLELPEIVEFVKKLNVNSHSFDVLRGSIQDGVQILPPPVEEMPKINKIRREVKQHYAKNYPLFQRLFTNIKERYITDSQLRVIKKGKLKFECVAGKNVAVLNSNGTLGICELLPVIGDLRKEEYNFNKIWQNNKANTQREGIKKHACDCTHYCFLSMSIDHDPLTVFLRMPMNSILKNVAR